jgi:hypothetical protein
MIYFEYSQYMSFVLDKHCHVQISLTLIYFKARVANGAKYISVHVSLNIHAGE